MATTVTKTVKSSGGDYTSLSAWEAGQQADITLATGNDTIQVAECYTMTDTTGVAIDGWTTGSGNYIRIYTPSAERHTGVRSTGYRLESAGGSGIHFYEEYLRLEGLALKSAGGGDGCRGNWTISTSSDIRIEACLLYDSTRGAYLPHGVYKISNTIAIGNSGDGIRVDNENTSTTAYLYNNTCCANGTYGINRVNGTVHSKNNYCGGNTTADYNGTFSTLTKSGSSDTTGTASYQSIAYATGSGAYFTNVTAGTQNLHIGASSALLNVADDLSADANYPITVDIDGTTRSDTWDIGADEYVAAGGGQPARRRLQQSPIGVKGVWVN